MLIHDVINAAGERAGAARLKDIRIGLGYLGVELDDGRLGCAFVFRSELGPHCGVLQEAGSLIGRTARELASWAASEQEILKASIGVAVLNALTDYEAIEHCKYGDMLEHIMLGPEDRVGMIGYFKPIIDEAKLKAKELIIFERHITSDDTGIYPDWAEEQLLPTCDVVIITGTTMINKTTDRILRLCTRAREVALVGPSTLMYPEVFRGSGVTLLAGSRIEPASKQKFFDTISQGGGGKEMIRLFTKYTVRLQPEISRAAAPGR